VPEKAIGSSFHNEPPSQFGSLTVVDPWENRMAEGVAFLQRKVKEENSD
jgi:hypothetical protein